MMKRKPYTRLQRIAYALGQLLGLLVVVAAVVMAGLFTVFIVYGAFALLMVGFMRHG